MCRALFFLGEDFEMPTVFTTIYCIKSKITRKPQIKIPGMFKLEPFSGIVVFVFLFSEGF